MAKIQFINDGYTLAGNLFMPKGEQKKLAFLFIHGWVGHQYVDEAQALSGIGHPTMTYDMRGHGESAGNLADFSRADYLEDAAAAYDFFKKQLGEGIKIGVVGSSFGSYTGVLLTEKRDVFCLSLRVPASYPDGGFNAPQLAQVSDARELMAWRQHALDYTQNRAFGALHRFTGSVQIIEAEADECVPSQGPANYANAVSDKIKLRYDVMVNAPHSLVNGQLRAEYERLLLDWVKALS
jgi:uncharacterized protein